MHRRDGIGERLRAGVPRAEAPGRVRDAVERAVAASGPGSARAVPARRAGPALAAAGAVLIAGGTLAVLLRPAPAPEAPIAWDEPAGPAIVPVDNPLVDEAHRVWADLQRLRSTVEGPVRVLTEAGRSL